MLKSSKSFANLKFLTINLCKDVSVSKQKNENYQPIITVKINLTILTDFVTQLCLDSSLSGWVSVIIAKDTGTSTPHEFPSMGYSMKSMTLAATGT